MPDVRNPLPALFEPFKHPYDTLSKFYPSSKDSSFRKLVDLFSAATTLLEMQVSCLTSEAKGMLKGGSELIKNGDAVSRVFMVIKKGDYLYSLHGLVSNALAVYVFAQKYFFPDLCKQLNAYTFYGLTNVALKTGNVKVIGATQFFTDLGIEKIAKIATILFLVVESVKIGKTLFYDGVEKQHEKEIRILKHLYEKNDDGTFSPVAVRVCQRATLSKSEEELRSEIVKLEWKGFDYLLKIPCVILPFTSASLLTRNVVNAASGCISIVAAVA